MSAGFQAAEAQHAHGFAVASDFHADFFEFVEQRGEVIGIAVGDHQIAARDCARDDEGAGFDAVRNDAVLRSVQLWIHPSL